MIENATLWSCRIHQNWNRLPEMTSKKMKCNQISPNLQPLSMNLSEKLPVNPSNWASVIPGKKSGVIFWVNDIIMFLWDCVSRKLWSVLNFFCIICIDQGFRGRRIYTVNSTLRHLKYFSGVQCDILRHLNHSVVKYVLLIVKTLQKYLMLLYDDYECIILR